MKINILFLCQFFYPEYVSSAKLPYDLANALTQTGYSVGAICGFPKEYLTISGINAHESINKIEIKRLRYLQLERSNMLGRIVNYLSFTLASLLHIFSMHKYKIIIVYSNPPILPLIALLAKFMFDNKIIFVGFDIYPEIAQKTNIITENSKTYRILMWISNLTMKYSDRIVVLSEDMKNFLLNNRKDISNDCISVIPIWDTGGVEVNNKYKQTKRFIVTYLGNMGTCQEMTTILDAAEIFQRNNVNDIQFVLAGHGNKLLNIKEYTTKQSLTNVKIHNYLQGEKFNELLDKSGCFVLSLEKNMIGLCLPSKICTYLLASRPSIAIMENEFELVQNLEKYNAGFSVLQGESEKLVEYIQLLKNNYKLCVEMGRNAKRLYEDRYSKSINLNKFVELVEGLDGSIRNVH